MQGRSYSIGERISAREFFSSRPSLLAVWFVVRPVETERNVNDAAKQGSEARAWRCRAAHFAPHIHDMTHTAVPNHNT